jgi:hypothetical protein
MTQKESTPDSSRCSGRLWRVDGPLPLPALAEANRWATSISRAWARLKPELPEVGAHRWHADMAGWLEGTADDLDRATLARVMQQLRRAAPREYDVLYRTLLLGEGFEEVAVWLNERAQRNGIPLPDGSDTHYQTKDAVALFEAGITFVRTYW